MKGRGDLTGGGGRGRTEGDAEGKNVGIRERGFQNLEQFLVKIRLKECPWQWVGQQGKDQKRE